jgi:endonuclease G
LEFMAYDEFFLNGHEVPLPLPDQDVLNSAYCGGYIHHSRHSILFNIERGFAFVSAHNIDGNTLPNSQYTSRGFRNDPLISPSSLQVDRDRGYRESPQNGLGPNPWDQGHLARRKGMSWGEENVARIAERESDYWSNIVPQHETLHDHPWGNIEDWVMDLIRDDQNRASVFTGPVFSDEDKMHKNGPNEEPIYIPAGFWKIMCVEKNGALRSAAFIVLQKDYFDDDRLPSLPGLNQVRVSIIELLTGLRFPFLDNTEPIEFGQSFPDQPSRATLEVEMMKRSNLMTYGTVFPSRDAEMRDLRFSREILRPQDILL